MRSVDSEPPTEINPAPSANIRSKAFFEAHIAAEWRKNVEGILRVGHLLNQAKDELDHGVFGAL